MCLQVMTCLANATAARGLCDSHYFQAQEDIDFYGFSTCVPNREEARLKGMFACVVPNLVPTLRQPQRFFFSSERFVNTSG